MTVRASGVCVARGDGAPLLHDVELHVAPGEVVSVFGRSGAGKTALALTLAGGRAPLSGTLRIPDSARIGVLPPFPERHFVSFTVAEEVAADGAADGAAGERDVADALDAVGLPHDADFGRRSPWSLSLGEQRRVALASNLVRERDLFVWDEPTASLDAVERGRLASVVSRVREGGAAVVTTGHDLVWSAGIGARLVGLDGGGLTEIDLTTSEGRSDMFSMGYEIPPLWAYFSGRVPAFWRAEHWRRPAGELAALATSSRH